MIRNAGFKTGKDVDGAAWVNLWGGIACIHSGVKIWSRCCYFLRSFQATIDSVLISKIANNDVNW